MQRQKISKDNGVCATTWIRFARAGRSGFRSGARALLACAVLAWVPPLAAAAPRAYAGDLGGAVAAVGGSDKLRYWAETRLRLSTPISENWFVEFDHLERIVFLDLDQAPPSGSVQMDRMGRTDLLTIAARPAPLWALGLAAGRVRTDLADRPGSLEAYVAGPSVRFDLPDRGIFFDVVFGPLFGEENMDNETWSRVEARLVAPGPFDGLGLDLSYEALGDPVPSAGYVNVGPSFQAVAGDVDLRLAIHYVRIEDAPLVSEDDSGWALWVEMRAHSEDAGRRAADQDLRASGSYRLGYGDEGQTDGFEADILWAPEDRPWAGVVTYAARRDMGDASTGTYRVSAGPGLRFGLPSLPGDAPGSAWGIVEFFHRSDHAFDADPTRVAQAPNPSDLGPMLEHTNANVFPRFALFTPGWLAAGRVGADLPLWDVFLSAGRLLPGHGHKQEFAGQIGLRLNVIRSPRWTGYLRAVASTGGEAPRQGIEVGCESGPWLVFARWDDYGMDEALGETSNAAVGLGIRM